jgi:hypothetical protein
VSGLVSVYVVVARPRRWCVGLTALIALLLWVNVTGIVLLGGVAEPAVVSPGLGPPGSRVMRGDARQIGRIGQVYYDDDTDQPKWVTVHTGLFGTNESFVPLQEARFEGGTVTLGYDKQKNATNSRDPVGVAACFRPSTQEPEEDLRLRPRSHSRTAPQCCRRHHDLDRIGALWNLQRWYKMDLR